MIKCTFYLPLHDNDGNQFPESIIRGITAEIAMRFGGYTIGAFVSGCCTMADGTFVSDRLQPVTVCVEDQVAVAELRSLVAKFSRELGQETMYFEVSSAVVEFVNSQPQNCCRTFDFTTHADAADRQARQGPEHFTADDIDSAAEPDWILAGWNPPPVGWNPSHWQDPITP